MKNVANENILEDLNTLKWVLRQHGRKELRPKGAFIVKILNLLYHSFMYSLVSLLSGIGGVCSVCISVLIYGLDT